MCARPRLRTFTREGAACSTEEQRYRPRDSLSQPHPRTGCCCPLALSPSPPVSCKATGLSAILSLSCHYVSLSCTKDLSQLTASSSPLSIITVSSRGWPRLGFENCKAISGCEAQVPQATLLYVGACADQRVARKGFEGFRNRGSGTYPMEYSSIHGMHQAL